MCVFFGIGCRTGGDFCFNSPYFLPCMIKNKFQQPQRNSLHNCYIFLIVGNILSKSNIFLSNFQIRACDPISNAAYFSPWSTNSTDSRSGTTDTAHSSPRTTNSTNSCSWTTDTAHSSSRATYTAYSSSSATSSSYYVMHNLEKTKVSITFSYLIALGYSDQILFSKQLKLSQY